MALRETEVATLPVGDRWVNLDPGLRFIDRSPLDLLAYWQRQRHDRPLPSRSDIDPLEIRDHLPNLLLIDIEHAPARYRYRLIGTAVAASLGRDSTGFYFDELYEPALMRSAVTSFDWLITNKQPLRTWGEAFHPDKDFYWYEAINLPLAGNGTDVDMLLVELRFHGADVPLPD